mmetsp:Transcript_44101/g.106298  ORF Transcript_44101/g.106298 Transcript_44101/m.106298 type:complete len:225 (-) Transcript_44101:41-715(-)
MAVRGDLLLEEVILSAHQGNLQTADVTVSQKANLEGTTAPVSLFFPKMRRRIISEMTTASLEKIQNPSQGYRSKVRSKEKAKQFLRCTERTKMSRQKQNRRERAHSEQSSLVWSISVRMTYPSIHYMEVMRMQRLKQKQRKEAETMRVVQIYKKYQATQSGRSVLSMARTRMLRQRQKLQEEIRGPRVYQVLNRYSVPQSVERVRQLSPHCTAVMRMRRPKQSI